MLGSSLNVPELVLGNRAICTAILLLDLVCIVGGRIFQSGLCVTHPDIPRRNQLFNLYSAGAGIELVCVPIRPRSQIRIWLLCGGSIAGISGMLFGLWNDQ